MSLKRVGLAALALLLLSACGGRTQPAPPATAPGPAWTPPAALTADAPVAASSGRSSAEPSPTSTPTPTLRPTATPTPTFTPTVSPTATPTPLPHERLATGRWLQAIGDCAAARREFAAVVADLPGQTEARYRLAQCYLRDDANGEAAVVLVALLALAPADDPYRGPAHFALGEALTALGRPADAEASYTAFLGLAPELSALAWQRIAAARRGAGDLPAAAKAYAEALKTSPDWQSTVAIRRALADLAMTQGDPTGAAAQYDLLRNNATTGAWAAEMQWLAGAALTQGPDPAQAVPRWQAAAAADPASDFAYKAVVALLDAGATVDEYQRGLVNFHRGNYALALAAFDRLRLVEPAGRGGAAWYYAGVSYLRLGQTGNALVELGNFIAAHEESSLWAKAWLAQAEAQAKAGDVSAAIAVYRKFAALRPSAVEAPQALWRAAGLEVGLAGPLPAAESYLALGRQYPAANEGWRGYQTAGLIYFRAGDYRRAAEVWGEMAGGAAGAPASPLPEWTRPVAHYWLGRAQAAAGDAAARRSWQIACEAGPDTFYGLRAADRLPAVSPTTQPAITPQPPGAPAAERAALAAWLLAWAGEGSLELPPALLADADWRRGELLLTLGWRTAGLTHWERVQRRYAADSWTLAALALAFRDAGANRLSMLCAEELVARWGQPMREAPPELQRLDYPLPYGDLIRAEAARRNLDPRLVAAVMRQESRFEWAATSSAGAQGLMQLMPATAEWIASRLSWPGFQSQQAYWPYVNVAFGAYYLRLGLDQFDGSLAAALAGYNGGPGNAAAWRKDAGGDDDLMVALIPYDETRLYVQTIWAQYDAYRRLYPETGK